ncbi:MAG: hypothetical protein IPJ19_07480 [Planctomycetes bacterium]|nr:hypothetical protein [Planctomycetota bacterium]
MLSLQLCVLLAAGITAEVAVRIVKSVRGDGWSSESTRTALEQARGATEVFSASAGGAWFKNPDDDPQRALHLHPYFGWESGTREICTDADLEFQRKPANANAYELMLLGGSVASMFGIEEYGAAELRAQLLADPRFQGREIHIMNVARGGSKQPQQVNRLVYLLALGIRIDGVIELDGFNEVALGNKNAKQGIHPVFPSGDHWAYLGSTGATDRKGIDLMLELRLSQRAVAAACDRALDWQLYRSALFGSIALGNVHQLQQRVGLQQEECTRYLTLQSSNVVRGPVFASNATGAVGESLRSWYQCSLTMQEICRARSIHYLHVLQPTLHDKGSKPVTKRELETGAIDPSWLQGVQLGYPRMRAAGSALREHGVNYYDASGVFAGVEGPIYHDACHFGPPGNKILARAIAKAYLDSMPAK